MPFDIADRTDVKRKLTTDVCLANQPENVKVICVFYYFYLKWLTTFASYSPYMSKHDW